MATLGFSGLQDTHIGARRASRPVIYYGDNLLGYVAHEFKVPPLHPGERRHVPFWSDLAGGLEAVDL